MSESRLIPGGPVPEKDVMERYADREQSSVIPLHPAVQHLATIDNMTLEQRAIVGLMRASLNLSLSHYQDLKKWLMQENPLHLRGKVLTEWATEVASYVLPPCLRGL